MAIPFVMPGEEPDDNLDQLIIELSDIIIQIQLLLRERARRQMMERRNRVCCAAGTSRRSRYGSNVELNNRIPPSTAANELSSNICDGRIEAVTNLTSEDENDTEEHVGGNRRTRANSETCSKETVDIGNGNQNWRQVGVKLQRIVEDDLQSSDNKDEETTTAEKTTCRQDGSILSKFVPAPLKSSIWTAVICVVGWHLLRTR